MKLNQKYTVLWILWALAFGIIEWKAIKNKEPGDTLSEHIWKLVGTQVDGRTTEQWLFRIGLGGGLLWLIVHFFTKGL